MVCVHLLPCCADFPVVMLYSALLSRWQAEEAGNQMGDEGEEVCGLSLFLCSPRCCVQFQLTKKRLDLFTCCI